MSGTRYVFQQSRIWESGDPVDPHGERIKRKARSEDRARKTLPDPGMGRRWVLVDTIRTASPTAPPTTDAAVAATTKENADG